MLFPCRHNFEFNREQLSAFKEDSRRASPGFHRGLAGSGPGFGGLGSGEWTRARRLLGHEHVVLRSAIGRNVSLHCALTDKSNATHPQLLWCLRTTLQVAINAWDGA